MATKVKTVFNGETRRVKLAETTFAALLGGVRKSYSLEQELKLSWKDDEGDSIVIADDDGLEDAIEESGKMLKVFVEVVGAAQTGSAPPEQRERQPPAPPEQRERQPHGIAAHPEPTRPQHSPRGNPEEMEARGRERFGNPRQGRSGREDTERRRLDQGIGQMPQQMGHDRYQTPNGFRGQGQDRQQYQKGGHDMGYQNSHANTGRQQGQGNSRHKGQPNQQHQNGNGRNGGDRRAQQTPTKLNPRAAGFQPHSPMGRAQKAGQNKFSQHQFGNTNANAGRQSATRSGGQAPAANQWDNRSQRRMQASSPQPPVQGLQMPPNISPELLPDEQAMGAIGGFGSLNGFRLDRDVDPTIPWQQQQEMQYRQQMMQLQLQMQRSRQMQQQRKMNNGSPPEAFFGNFSNPQLSQMQAHGLPTSFAQGKGQQRKAKGRRGAQGQGRRQQSEVEWANKGWHPAMDSPGVLADAGKLDGGKRERNGQKGRGKKGRTKTGQDTTGAGKRGRQSRRKQVKEPIKWKAQIVKHVTLKDRSSQMPGQILEKVWLMKNIGSQVWKDVQLICVKEDADNPMNVEEAYPIPKCNTGREVEVKAYIQVPKKEGRHCSYYRLCNSNGRRFGPRIWADIISGFGDTGGKGRLTGDAKRATTGGGNNADAKGANEYDSALDVRQYLKNAESARETAYKKKEQNTQVTQSAGAGSTGETDEMKCSEPTAI